MSDARAAVRWLAIAGVTVWTACFQPSYPVGLVCSERQGCPPDQTCGASGRCEIGVTPPEADASVIDASVIDASAIDAGPIDAAPADADLGPDAVVPTFAIGGVVTGLSRPGLRLRLNGGHEITIDADGAFTFTPELATGTAYLVTVEAAPTGSPALACTVDPGSGVVAAEAVTVRVTCEVRRFAISGVVTGMRGTTDTLVLDNNGGDELQIHGDQGFAFPTAVVDGGGYSVRVRVQPAGRFCRVERGAGVVASADVADVSVVCSPSCFTFHNGDGEDLVGNQWFDDCASHPGTTVSIQLTDDSGAVAYQARGTKVGAWTFDSLTSTAIANQQYNVAVHDRLVVLDNGDRMMIAGRDSDNAGCHGSMGGGYGIVIYRDVANGQQNIRLMVMSYAQIGPPPRYVGPRMFVPGWSTGHEITWSVGGSMNSCGTMLPAFTGTVAIAVTD